MKHGYKEVRKLFADDLINLCVRNRWYTCGYNTVHYHFLYEFAERKENITTGDIVELAQDIMKSSDTDLELTSICYEIAKTCKTFFVEAVAADAKGEGGKMKKYFRIKYTTGDGKKKRREFATEAGLRRFVENNNLYGFFLLSMGTPDANGAIIFYTLGFPEDKEEFDTLLSSAKE